MKKRGGFRIKEHLCQWTNQDEYFSLHIWFYIDSIDALEEFCADKYFQGKTIKEASAKFKDWLSKANLTDLQDERGI